MLHSSSCGVYVPTIGHKSHPFTFSIPTTHRPPSLRFRPDLIWFLWSVFLLANLPVALLPTAHAATYEIVFEEGAFQYDSDSPAENQDNKYLARVTVIKDGQILAKNIRGSTLPDAWAFYKHWNVDLKKTLPPTDTDVLTVFKDFEKQTTSLRESKARVGGTMLADLADILDVLNRVPVLSGGKYPFVMGIHQGGKSVHGKPYVPRLLGGTKERPYSAGDSSSRASAVGGYIKTLNKNNAQHQAFIATGINVHDGRKSEDYKDSEGCLTIRPQDWNTFYRALPTPGEWKKGRHIGVVHIRRGSASE